MLRRTLPVVRSREHRAGGQAVIPDHPRSLANHVGARGAARLVRTGPLFQPLVKGADPGNEILKLVFRREWRRCGQGLVHAPRSRFQGTFAASSRRSRGLSCGGVSSAFIKAAHCAS